MLPIKGKRLHITNKKVEQNREGAPMRELREKLLDAYQSENFIQTALEFTSSGGENNAYDVLVALHNEGSINLIEQFKNLCNKKNSNPDFFLARDLLQKALPALNAPVRHVMSCVAHLSKEAGQDLTANTIFASFIDFCSSDPSRPEQALRFIIESPNQWMDFVTPVIVAGTRIDMSRYFIEAIRLTSHQDIEIRKRAIFSIGRIQYSGQSDLLSQALDCLERLAGQETDDHLLGNAISSTCSICILDGSLVDRGVKIIDLSLLKGGEYALHAASELFGFNIDKLPEPLLGIIMKYLLRINPKNERTVDMIDYGVLRLLQRDDPTLGIEFIESFLLTYSQNLSLKSLDSVVRGISRSDKLLNKLLTRWFLKGDRVLCDGIRAVVDAVHGKEMHLGIDSNELSCSDEVHLIFLAHKAIGYLFLKPISSASIIISLIDQANDDNTVHRLGSLLFDPLLLNFSGSLRDFLVSRVAKESGQTQNAIQGALDAFDAYLQNLKSIGVVPEMHPSQKQREAHARYLHQLMSDSYKEAMKGSIINLLCSKSVILYGNKSINYIQEPSGQSRRMEIAMSSHGTEIEVPRQEHIDPFGLDYMLRIFRAERLVKA